MAYAKRSTISRAAGKREVERAITFYRDFRWVDDEPHPFLILSRRSPTCLPSPLALPPSSSKHQRITISSLPYPFSALVSEGMAWIRRRRPFFLNDDDVFPCPTSTTTTASSTPSVEVKRGARRGILARVDLVVAVTR
ncbi:hypothetical protein EJB05_13212, partial [Eragrostis curvula]